MPQGYLLQRQLSCCPREEYLAGQAAPLPTDVLYSVLLLYKYEGVFKDALHKIKFEGEAGLLPLLREEAELAAERSGRKAAAKKKQKLGTE